MSTENENIEVTEEVTPVVTESTPVIEESKPKAKTKSKKRKKPAVKVEATVEPEVETVARPTQFKKTKVKTMQGRPRSTYKKAEEVPTKVDKSTNIANRDRSFDFS
jgi:hypothetical protein